MQYKTIVLQLLRQHRELHHELRSNGTLQPTLDRYASELKTNHEILKDQLARANPGSDENQIASEALEIALSDLENCLPKKSAQDEEDQPLSLDGAMAFARRHTPPA